MTSEGMSSATPPTKTARAVRTVKIVARPSTRRCQVGLPSSLESCSAMAPKTVTNTPMPAIMMEAIWLSTAMDMKMATMVPAKSTGRAEGDARPRDAVGRRGAVDDLGLAVDGLAGASRSSRGSTPS
jgi:hypothetical protein